MTTEPQHPFADCRRVADILARVGDKWTILLLMALGNRRMRFGELHRAINGISQRMLTVTLRNLEHDGILNRTVYPTIPPRVEYSLTKLGKTLEGPLCALSRWSEQHMKEVEAAQRAFDAKTSAA